MTKGQWSSASLIPPAPLRAWRQHVTRVAAGLTPEGGQPWHPGGSARQRRLGRPGQVTGGNTARSAGLLAYYVRVTGDTELMAPARAALDRLETFRVPRGAQGWECPLHCPDILAAAPDNDNAVFNVSPKIGDHIQCALLAAAEEIGFVVTPDVARCAPYAAEDPTVPDS